MWIPSSYLHRIGSLIDFDVAKLSSQSLIIDMGSSWGPCAFSASVYTLFVLNCIIASEIKDLGLALADSIYELCMIIFQSFFLKFEFDPSFSNTTLHQTITKIHKLYITVDDLHSPSLCYSRWISVHLHFYLNELYIRLMIHFDNKYIRPLINYFMYTNN